MSAVNGKDRDLADSYVFTHEIAERIGDLKPANLDFYGDLPNASNTEPELTRLAGFGGGCREP
jgi:hypothetical protein